MKSVFVKINPVGKDVSHNFLITADVGVTSPTSATKLQLLSGIIVDVDNLATTIILICTSILCPDKDIVITIDATTTTTTIPATTTTTTQPITTTTTSPIGPPTTTTTTTCNSPGYYNCGYDCMYYDYPCVPCTPCEPFPITTTTTTIQACGLNTIIICNAITTTTTTGGGTTTTTTTTEEPPPPQLKILNADTNCDNLTITINVTDGLPPYFYSINNGRTLIESSNTTYTFTNITGGVYDVYVKDSYGYFYLWPEQICDLQKMITVIFETVYISSYATGFIYDENSIPYTTSFSITQNKGTVYNSSSLNTNSSTFLGWSFAINGSKPNKSNITKVNYLSKANEYQHTFNYDTTVYAIFDKSGPKYLDFCYFTTTSGYIATDIDMLYYCPNCDQTIRVYFNENQYNTIGFEKITWYKNSNLTTIVDPGYYKLSGTTKTIIYRLENGVSVYGGSCPNEPVLITCSELTTSTTTIPTTTTTTLSPCAFDNGIIEIIGDNCTFDNGIIEIIGDNCAFDSGIIDIIGDNCAFDGGSITLS